MVGPVIVVVGRVGSGTLPLPRWPDTTVCAASGKAALSDEEEVRRRDLKRRRRKTTLENLISSLFTSHRG